MNLHDDIPGRRYCLVSKYSGKGINLYYDKKDLAFILERDNREDILEESFINAKFVVDFNFNKLISKFSTYKIIEVENNVSPNTLKQGYLKFQFLDKEENPIEFTPSEGIFYITIKKIN
jgi:hypothetical protein